MTTDKSAQKFSQLLADKLSTPKPITIEGLVSAFGEKSFAGLLLLLLAVPALPLPTGGITHIFEIIALLISVEMIAGRKTLWLPERWSKRTLPAGLQTSILPKFIKVIKWVEKYSRPRLRTVQKNHLYTRTMGVVFLLFTVSALLAPPFSGLDTLSSIGIMILSLSIILEDTLLAIVGLIVGSAGIALILLIGRLAFQLF